jgi:hypothetical protein
MPNEVLKNKLLSTVDLGDSVQKITQFYKSNNQIKLTDLNKILDSIRLIADRRNKIVVIPLIRVLNGDKWASFKSEEDLENYYEGKVKEVRKFTKFFQVQITTILEK